MNSLQDFGRWGSNFLGEASTQLGSAAATASNLGSSGIQKGTDLFRSGAKKASQSMKLGAKHTLEKPRGGIIVITETCFLAEGAFGAVTKVKDELGNDYALKKIACQEGVQVASSLKAAECEANILKNLPPHDNIIRLFGSSVDHHGPGSATVKLLLELCPGGTLLDYMDSKDGKLSAKEVINPFAQIVEAVGFLHAQTPPIQHRDLKVENVLMGADGRWKLCDFGSCSTEVVPPTELSRQRFLELQEDIDKTVTMLYRPPEMADIDLNYRNGYTINTQVDVWMLGCILFTLTFYRHPFQDCPTASAVCSGKYFIPDDHPLGKSQKLCGLIHWLLAKDPKDRPIPKRILDLLREIGKIQYQDLFQMMPAAVQEKIKKHEALFSKRKDTGDMPLPPAAAALMAGNSRSSGASAGECSPSKSAQQQRRPSNQSNQSRGGGAQASSQPPPCDGFDLMSALASSDTPTPQSRSSAASSKPRAAPAQQEDLLSLGDPTPAPSRAPVAAPAVPEFGDLLGFVDSTPAVSTGAAPAASASAAGCDFASFADFTSAPAVAAAPAPPANADWCDFANFASAPTPTASSGYSANNFPAAPAPASSPSSAAVSNDLIGFDFADPLAPSPAPTSGPFNDPTAQSCSGAARAAAPAPAASMNLLDLNL
jgi:serine/threonine protein kinase